MTSTIGNSKLKTEYKITDLDNTLAREIRGVLLTEFDPLFVFFFEDFHLMNNTGPGQFIEF